jgi:hypothetical protein
VKKRQVSRKQGIQLAEKHNMLYLETSALSGVKIEEVQLYHFESIDNFLHTIGREQKEKIKIVMYNNP